MRNEEASILKIVSSKHYRARAFVKSFSYILRGGYIHQQKRKTRTRVVVEVAIPREGRRVVRWQRVIYSVRITQVLA